MFSHRREWLNQAHPINGPDILLENITEIFLTILGGIVISAGKLNGQQQDTFTHSDEGSMGMGLLFLKLNTDLHN